MGHNHLTDLLKQVRACTHCHESLPFEPRPVLAAASSAKILIVGQAPGTRVHRTGIPWNDPSGNRLREWMGIDREIFYDETQIAIIPMGFCYPGKGKSGDLPPRPECAPLWHEKLLAQLPHLELTLLIGQYAQAYYLGERRKKTLTETVKNWNDYGPDFLPMPHPSPRNTLWLKKNKWFETDVIPIMRDAIHRLVGCPKPPDSSRAKRHPVP